MKESDYLRLIGETFYETIFIVGSKMKEPQNEVRKKLFRSILIRSQKVAQKSHLITSEEFLIQCLKAYNVLRIYCQKSTFAIRKESSIAEDINCIDSGYYSIDMSSLIPETVRKSSWTRVLLCNNDFDFIEECFDDFSFEEEKAILENPLKSTIQNDETTGFIEDAFFDFYLMSEGSKKYIKSEVDDRGILWHWIQEPFLTFFDFESCIEEIYQSRLKFVLDYNLSMERVIQFIKDEINEIEKIKIPEPTRDYLKLCFAVKSTTWFSDETLQEFEKYLKGYTRYKYCQFKKEFLSKKLDENQNSKVKGCEFVTPMVENETTKYFASYDINNFFESAYKRTLNGSVNEFYQGDTFITWLNNSNLRVSRFREPLIQKKDELIDFNHKLNTLVNDVIALYKQVRFYELDFKVGETGVHLSKTKVLKTLKNIQFYSKKIKYYVLDGEQDCAIHFKNYCVEKFEEIIFNIEDILFIRVYDSPLKEDFEQVKKTLLSSINLEELQIQSKYSKPLKLEENELSSMSKQEAKEVLTNETYYNILEKCTDEAFETLKLIEFYPKDGSKAIWDVSTLKIENGDGKLTESHNEVFRNHYIEDNMRVTFLQALDRFWKTYEINYSMTRVFFYKKCYQSLLFKVSSSTLWSEPDYGIDINNPCVLTFVWNMRGDIEARSKESNSETHNLDERSKIKKISFENKFDRVEEKAVFDYFKMKLVDKNYISDLELNTYLSLAFEKKIAPQEKFNIKDLTTKNKIVSIFYNYYKEIASSPYGRQSEYLDLLKNYFNGFEKINIRNFSK